MKRFPAGDIPVEWIFLRFFYIFLARFSSVKINAAVVCLSFVANMVRFGKINDDEFTEFCYVENEMLCTKHIIAFSLRTSFPTVLSI